MSHLLVAVAVILAVLIVGLTWVWLVRMPKTGQYRPYKALSSDHAIRNRAWDAAVARARNRHHRSF